jgi:hypothetical protein
VCAITANDPCSLNEDTFAIIKLISSHSTRGNGNRSPVLIQGAEFHSPRKPHPNIIAQIQQNLLSPCLKNNQIARMPSAKHIRIQVKQYPTEMCLGYRYLGSKKEMRNTARFERLKRAGGYG